MATKYLAVILSFCFLSMSKANNISEITLNVKNIDYYQNQIQLHPTSYALYTILATHYINKAKLTGSTSALTNAQHNLELVLKKQPNFSAYKTMADLFSYQHKFKEALSWAKQAAKIHSQDTSLFPLMTEIYLGLGQTNKAKTYLNSKLGKSNYHLEAANAKLNVALKKHDIAATHFKAAAQFANEVKPSYQQQKALLWAMVNIAGMYLDSNQLKLAKVHLDKATLKNPQDKFLNIHWAEYYQAIGHNDKALLIIQDLMPISHDPDIYAIASNLAIKLQQTDLALQYYEKAEQHYKKIINENFIYTLGGLAQLYCDNNRNLNKALKLAKQNLLYKNDTQAVNTLKCIVKKVANIDHI